MNKIKKFIQDNKQEMKVIAYGTGMLLAGVYIGKRYENLRWNDLLNTLARRGLTVNNFVDGKEYMLSITEVKVESLT
jgi:hypothetical protein